MRNIAVLVGSLRQESINRKYAQALEKLSAGQFAFDHVDMDLPLYNDDLWQAPPAKVVRLKEQILAADGVLIITPEYNRSIPAVTKNAIDWASRPPQRTLAGKPAAVMGASVTPGGARGGIESVKRSLRRAGSEVLDDQVAVPSAANAFDVELHLADPLIRAEVAELVASLAARARGSAAEKLAA